MEGNKVKRNFCIKELDQNQIEKTKYWRIIQSWRRREKELQNKPRPLTLEDSVEETLLERLRENYRRCEEYYNFLFDQEALLTSMVIEENLKFGYDEYDMESDDEN